MGKPSSGKSTSLMNLKNQEAKVYLNTDMKELPFQDNFAKNIMVSDPTDILPFIHEIEAQASIDGVILDTMTFLMDMYEQQYVKTATNTQQAWGNYAGFYKSFIHAIKSGTKNYAIMAHEMDVLNESEMCMESKVPVKGSVGKTGCEADFTTILSAKKVKLKDLEGWENDLLNITEDEKEDGFKYVFQTRIDKDSIGGKMRSAIGLWSRKEKYIDNDIEQVFNRLNQYYNKSKVTL